MIKRILSFFGAGKNSSTATPKTITDQWFPSHYMTGANTTGETVNQGNALTLSAVYACVNLISQDVSKVPFHCYRGSDRGKDRIRNNIDNLLNYRPNFYMSAMDFRRVLTAHVLTYGNGYAEIERNINNEIIGLWILPPDKVKPIVQEGMLYYEVRTTDSTYTLLPEEVIHLKGLGFDGIKGYSVIQYAAQTLGIALAAEKTAGALFGNGCITHGHLEHPANLSDRAAKNIRDSHLDYHQGASKAYKVPIYEEGMKWVADTIPPEQAQFLQTRAFNTTEICRFFRVSPIKVGDYSHATFSNVEQLSIDYVGDTLITWFRCWEQEVWYKLFNQEEREQGYFAEHVIEGLLRGDMLARYQGYAIGRQWGWFSVNMILQKENMNTIGEAGDIHLSPLNMVDVNTLGSTPMPDATQSKMLSKDIAERLGRAELTQLEKQLTREDYKEELFLEWAEKFYSKHNEYVSKTLSVLSNGIDPTAFTMQAQIFSAENKRGFFEKVKYEYISTLQEKINELFNK